MKNLLITIVLLPIGCLIGCGIVIAGSSTSSACLISVSPSPTPVKTPNIKVSEEAVLPPLSKFDRKIGVIDMDQGRFRCFRTRAAGLKPGTRVLLVDILSENFGDGQRVLEASVRKALNRSCARNDSDAGDDQPELTHYYTLRLEGNNKGVDMSMGIGVIAPAGLPKLVDKKVVLDVDNDGKPEYFRSCASSEGMHLTIWTGEPLKGKRVWHSYYYLNYDTEPTCDEKDWEGI
jgi:hypothetical protein